MRSSAEASWRSVACTPSSSCSGVAAGIAIAASRLSRTGSRLSAKLSTANLRGLRHSSSARRRTFSVSASAAGRRRTSRPGGRRAPGASSAGRPRRCGSAAWRPSFDFDGTSGFLHELAISTAAHVGPAGRFQEVIGLIFGRRTPGLTWYRARGRSTRRPEAGRWHRCGRRGGRRRWTAGRSATASRLRSTGAGIHRHGQCRTEANRASDSGSGTGVATHRSAVAA